VRVDLRQGFGYLWVEAEEEKGGRQVPADESGRGGQIQGVARSAAAVAVPLLLGAAAMALILDSGTVQLPPLGPGARSAAPPTAAKVIVSPPATVGHSTHRATGPATAPAAGGTPAAGAGAAGGGSAPTNLITGAGAPASAPTPKHSSGGSSGGPAPGSTGGGSGSGTPTTTTPEPPQQPTTATTVTKPAHPHGLALGHEKNHVPLGPAAPSYARRQHDHVPPGQARKAHRHHVPPGQERKHAAAPPADSQPPDRKGKDHHGRGSQAQAGKEQGGHGHSGPDDQGENHTPPGQEGGGNGHGSHGQGRGH
jgi:hypothetical protein